MANALRALVVIALVAGTMLLMVWVVPFLTTAGTDADNATPAAGSAIIHDDAGNVNTGLAPGYAPIHDDAGNVHPGTGSAVIHDDAGNENFVRRWRPPSAVIHDDAGNVNR